MGKKIISMLMVLLIMTSCLVPAVSAKDTGVVSVSVDSSDEAREYLGVLLSSAVEILTNSSTGEYTAESYQNLEQAVGEAYGVYYNPESSAEELSAQADNIKNAIYNMKTPAVSDEASQRLSDVIAKAQAQVGGEDEYTSESYAVYYNAYEYALYIQQQGKSDEEFAAAADALEGAVEALVPVDTSLRDAREYLWVMMNSAYNVLGSGERYTTESVNNLEAAIEAANTAYYNESATKQELEDATYNLKLAINAMRKVVISEEASTCLSDAISKADTEVGEISDYTADSWSAFADAYREAVRVSDTGESDEEFFAAAEALDAAINALVPVDTELIEARAQLLEAIKGAVVEQDKYTAESLASLETAVNEATAVYYNETATLEEIRQQITKVENAINTLVPISVAIEDAREELYAMLHSTPVGGNYTTESMEKLQTAIDEGWIVYENPDATLREILEQTALIKAALEALECVYIDPDVRQLLWDTIQSTSDRVGDKADYTTESWEHYDSVRFNATTTYYYGKSEQDYLNAIDSLNKAIDSLQLAYTYVLLGDVDGDGKVTIKDATFVQKCVAGLAELDENSNLAADSNQDGTVNIKDATEIQKHLAGLASCENIGKEVSVPAK